MFRFKKTEEPKPRQMEENQFKKASEQHYYLREYRYNKNDINAEQQNCIKMAADGSVIINNSNSLVAEQVTDFVNISLQQSVKLKAKDAINNLKTKLYIPSVSLSILTGILTFIAVFPKAISENYIRRNKDIIINIIESDAFILLWLLLLIITIIFWFISFFYKEKMERELSELTLESKQNELFDSFIRGREYFFKDDFTKYISEQLKGMGRFKKMINKSLISTVTIMDISQDISNLIINKAISKEIIEAVDTYSLSDEYEVNKWPPGLPSV